jgi:hypothetical protein
LSKIPRPPIELVRTIDPYENNQPAGSKLSNISLQRCEGRRDGVMLERILVYEIPASKLDYIWLDSSPHSSGCFVEEMRCSRHLRANGYLVSEGDKRGGRDAEEPF